jgi:hypothetical protein
VAAHQPILTAPLPRSDELAELRQEVRGLAERVAALEAFAPRRRLAVADRVALETFFPLIASAVPRDRLFSVRELVEHADVTRDVALCAVLAATTPRKLGRLLRRAAGIEIAGYVVSIVGRDRDGAVLRLSAV